MRKILLTFSALFLFLASGPAGAEPNDLVPEDGAYVFERSPAHGGWLAKVSSGEKILQISMSYQTTELYDLFQAMGKNGIQKLSCREARATKISGYFVAHLFSMGHCQF